MAILNAYRLPGDGVEKIYPSITPVNSFRVVFDTYFGTSLGLLEDRALFSLYGKRYHFWDVTKSVRALSGRGGGGHRRERSAGNQEGPDKERSR
jgi:hypothetical protein